MRVEDINIVKGALDTLGVSLADHEHIWTEGEKEIYDQAIEILNLEYKREKTL